MYNYNEVKRKQITRMKSTLDFGFGILFLGIGIFLTFKKYFPTKNFNNHLLGNDILIGILFMGYGCWRIYRGVKKNYFKESEE